MQLDINNPMHLRLRRLLADMVAKHASALEAEDHDKLMAIINKLLGMEMVFMEMLSDTCASSAILEVLAHMNRLTMLRYVTARAVA
ncbi:hypothetical protein [Shewanella sp. SE1]|uniref:hypothetical protein n=1 Tax=Shewanella sp. SE1 TaxID=2705014 RepID=UPI00138ED4E0|nr:hypothetical protein [Shewanella sp. SE1]NDO76139.1 hypothetical protein [Shewanella sp. SE1]